MPGPLPPNPEGRDEVVVGAGRGSPTGPGPVGRTGRGAALLGGLVVVVVALAALAVSLRAPAPTGASSGTSPVAPPSGPAPTTRPALAPGGIRTVHEGTVAGSGARWSLRAFPMAGELCLTIRGHGAVCPVLPSEEDPVSYRSTRADGGPDGAESCVFGMAHRAVESLTIHLDDGRSVEVDPRYSPELATGFFGWCGAGAAVVAGVAAGVAAEGGVETRPARPLEPGPQTGAG